MVSDRFSIFYQRLNLEVDINKILSLMKLALFCIFLALIHINNAGTLVLDPPEVYSVSYTPSISILASPQIIVLDPLGCSTEVDLWVRNQYWYYLPSADLCYVAHINYQGGFLYVHQYRNYIGTFLSISKYLNPSRNISVVTFVRLGDGYQSIQDLYEPIYLNPFTVSMNLGWGNYQVPQFGINQAYTWSESWAQLQFYKNKAAIDVASSKCAALDTLARKNYYYYLNGSAILSSANADFDGKGCYCQNTYVNLQGTWLVIGNYASGTINIDTFVRLGDGYDPSNVRKCTLFPSITSWSS